ncbi:hypothetical protein Acid345_0958 [Candidatus Koribacter versatilis Ellin345]|uniref:Uncharacterized protein n=1 Tax=Koribacter versatilis (strain Ellin345) TaxID=204669 RepID=Q1IT39_KORVE|nr:hypothetical protein [Candidatus Koribacter versatilis]ABF39961.1 hypothetical protein Acid345_0958 [Candidatus Koribacter versatilis Ellin345]
MAVAEKTEQFLRTNTPALVRRYVGFRLTLIVVLILAAWNILVYGIIMSSRTPAQYVAVHKAARDMMRSTGFFITFNSAVFVGFYAIYATRRTEYTYLRTYVFGMALAALVSEILNFVLPLPR